MRETRRRHRRGGRARRAGVLVGRLLALVLLCAGGTGTRANADCLRLAGDGIGGTGLNGSGDGIGGTGLIDDPGATVLSDASLSRIDGTGYPRPGETRERAHTGAKTPDRSWIYGTITGGGSLCVNGLRVILPSDTETSRGGSVIGIENLRIGQVVSIEATTRSGELVALRVSLEPALAGPVTHVDSARRRLDVMGERVELSRNAVLWSADQGGEIPLGAIRVGDFAAVHGLRDSRGRVIASHVARHETPDRASVRGFVAERDGVWSVGGVRVRAAGQSQWAPAGWARATGRWDAESSSLEDAEIGYGASMPAGVTRVSVEALVHGAGAGREISPAGLHLEASDWADRIGRLSVDTRVWLGARPLSPDRIDLVELRVAPRHPLAPRTLSDRSGGRSEAPVAE